MSGSEEVGKDNELFEIENTKLKRENESLKALSTKDYDRIAQLEQNIVKLEQERDAALKQRDTNLRNLESSEKSCAKLATERDQALQLHKTEQERHANTNNAYQDLSREKEDWKLAGDRDRQQYHQATQEIAVLKKALAEKEALLAGADEVQEELENALKDARDEADENEGALVWQEVINSDLERSFASLGQALTPQSLVKRFRELEQQQPQHMNRATSSTSMDAPDFDQAMPKHRSSSSDGRKTSLGDELDRVTGDELDRVTGDEDEQSDSGLDGEREERIDALEEVGAQPANGNPVGAVAVPPTEKAWWEALLEAPWWVKLVCCLLVMLWATTTIGAIHERQRWVGANVTPEMVRFYASPPTLGGVVGHLVSRGHSFGLHG